MSDLILRKSFFVRNFTIRCGKFTILRYKCISFIYNIGHESYSSILVVACKLWTSLAVRRAFGISTNWSSSMNQTPFSCPLITVAFLSCYRCLYTGCCFHTRLVSWWSCLGTFWHVVYRHSRIGLWHGHSNHRPQAGLEDNTNAIHITTIPSYIIHFTTT